jgi:hypothetical protein
MWHICRLLFGAKLSWRFILLLVVIALSKGGAVSALGFPANEHRLTTNPRSVVFEIRRTGGLLPSEAVQIFGDGRISASGPASVQDVPTQLRVPTLNGVLKLAEAVGFFGMPTTIFCRTAQTDVRELTVTINTVYAVRTVSTFAPCKAASFRQIYSVLLAISGVPEVP